MNIQTSYRQDNVFLVEIDGQYALIDQGHEQIHLVNEAGAWVWSRLGGPAEIPTAAQDGVLTFLNDLNRLQLLSSTPAQNLIGAMGALAEPPKVLSSTPLQVAANTSDDPFRSSW